MVFSSVVSFVRSPATALALSLVLGCGVPSVSAVDVGQFLPSFRVFSAKSLNTCGVFCALVCGLLAVEPCPPQRAVSPCPATPFAFVLPAYIPCVDS
ncbi:hypothetical protein P030_00795 [Anaplasma phagocytophilum str. CRT35]|nr:hypothetical protein P030_00795 [Anaplasma phagocytophilum str. CRT35]